MKLKKISVQLNEDKISKIYKEVGIIITYSYMKRTYSCMYNASSENKIKAFFSSLFYFITYDFIKSNKKKVYKLRLYTIILLYTYTYMYIYL
jgi:hypothetical protein